jgi:aspartate kinase
MGVALKAEKVEFYKDVSGVYTADPKKDSTAQLLQELDFDTAHELMLRGAKVLHPRSVMLAQKNYLPLHVLSFHEVRDVKVLQDFDSLGTWIGRSSKGQQSQFLYEDSTVING